MTNSHVLCTHCKHRRIFLSSYTQIYKLTNQHHIYNRICFFGERGYFYLPNAWVTFR
jgi:hypothetical protein